MVHPSVGGLTRRLKAFEEVKRRKRVNGDGPGMEAGDWPAALHISQEQPTSGYTLVNQYGCIPSDLPGRWFSVRLFVHDEGLLGALRHHPERTFKFRRPKSRNTSSRPLLNARTRNQHAPVSVRPEEG